jgi:hypothetical protein
MQTNSTPRRILKLPPSARGRPVTVYWVQAIGRRPPRVTHPTREAATAEALRLSQLPANAGVRFQVRESRYVTTFSDGAEVRS